MTDCAIAGIGIIGQKNVAFFNRPVVTLLEAPEKRAELADDHFALVVGNHGKSIVLLAYSG